MISAEKTLFLICFTGLAIIAYYGNISLQVGAGYSAKIICSSTFTSGRDFDRNIADDLSLQLPIYSIKKEDNSVSSSTLFGLIKRTANYDPIRNSCTLAAPGETKTIWETVSFHPKTIEPLSKSKAWPQGNDDASISQHSHINWENLDKIFKAAFHEPVIKEASILRNTRAAIIVYDGKIIAEAYADGFSESTPMLGWSMTKSLISTVIGARIQEGKLSLSDSNLLEEWKSDERSKITLDQLLRGKKITNNKKFKKPTFSIIFSFQWFGIS